ncbi:MAG: putative permease [Planctomycetaceae bacterium]|nr:putative permease [Planctomycetaceae bacterium]
MLNLLDRYLLGRYWQGFIVTFLALFGLYVVLDVFSNLDEFSKTSGGVIGIMREMAWYYLLRACSFFSTVGSMISVLGALMALALLLRHGELNPILSAGIPTYRLAVPLLMGNVFISLLLVANQELLIPRIANQLQVKPGQGSDTNEKIKPAWDYSNNIQILSGKLFFTDRRLADAEIVLPVPELVGQLTTVRSESAVYRSKSETQVKAGWHLSKVRPRFEALLLTRLGKEVILPGDHEDDLFIVTTIDFDQLANRNKFFENLSTRELMENAHNPSFSLLSLRAQTVHLHSRMTLPLFNLLLVLMVVPVIVRKESRGLVTNMGISLGVTTFALGLQQCCAYLAQAGIIRLDLAAWLPVIVCGILSAWFSGFIRT